MKLFVTIDDEEFEEIFFPDAQCIFCEVIGAYRLGDKITSRLGEEGIAFCEKCLKENYKKVRVEQ